MVSATVIFAPGEKRRLSKEAGQYAITSLSLRVHRSSSVDSTAHKAESEGLVYSLVDELHETRPTTRLLTTLVPLTSQLIDESPIHTDLYRLTLYYLSCEHKVL